jgi:hypothetical protein
MFAAGSTFTWIVVASFRFVLQERFSHRTKDWITTWGTTLYSSHEHERFTILIKSNIIWCCDRYCPC